MDNGTMIPEEILQTEFNKKFISLMQNAMIMSFYKYGPVREGYPHRVDAIGTLEHKLDLYKQTGNTEYLVDIANFAMIEFWYPRHKDAHFEGTDEGDGRVDLITQKLTTRPNKLI